MQLFRLILLGVILGLGYNCISQNKSIDSLQKIIASNPENCDKAKAVCQLGIEYQKLDQNEKAIDFGKQSLALSEKKSCSTELLRSYNLIGIAFDEIGKYVDARTYLQNGLNESIRLKNEEYTSIFYTNLGETCRNQADYAKALECFLAALKIDEGKKDEKRMVSDYFTLTLLFGNLDEVSQQHKYLSKALVLSKKVGNKSVEAKCYNITANLLSDENKIDSALYYYDKSYKLAKSINLKHLEAKVLANIGGIYRQQKDFINALKYIEASTLLNKEIEDYKFLAANYVSLGWIYKENGEYQKSKEYFDKTLELSKDRFIDSQIDAYKGLAFLAAKENNYKEAFELHIKFKEKEDSIYNLENSEQLGDIKTNFEVEKKATELKAEQEKLQLIAFEEKKRQQVVIVSVLCLLLVVVVFSVFLYKRFKLTNKQKEIIELKNQETEAQKNLIEEHRKEILDSIHYAKRIQNAILPQRSYIEKYLPEHFIFYQPKDIIAGDFYWMHVENDLVFLAAADATGHGVPGTIVSIVCSNALDKSVKEFKLTDTGKILDKTTELVLDTFSKSGEDINDGMDISLLCIDMAKKEVTWSGANNQLLYFYDGKMFEVKSNKQPIGKSENRIPFTTHTIPYLEGTSFYLMTDGFADQFGGPKGKKFKYKQLENLLNENVSKPLSEQLTILKHEFNKWKGDLEQIDDVTIIGVRI